MSSAPRSSYHLRRVFPRHRVNLERALRVGSRLGGHLVQGHVDGVGTVLHPASSATPG
ncbi:MAG: hypothetical protein U0133_04420 [Gemmatimonadales bacterium]